MIKEPYEEMHICLESEDGMDLACLELQVGNPENANIIREAQERLDDISNWCKGFLPRDIAMMEEWMKKNPWAISPRIWFDAVCRLRDGAVINKTVQGDYWYGHPINPESYDELMPEFIYREELYDPSVPFEKWEPVSPELHARMEKLREKYCRESEIEYSKR